MTGSLGTLKLGTARLADNAAASPDQSLTDTGAWSEALDLAADHAVTEVGVWTDTLTLETPPDFEGTVDEGGMWDESLAVATAPLTESGLLSESARIGIAETEQGTWTEALAVKVGPVRTVISRDHRYGPEGLLPCWTRAHGREGSLYGLLSQLREELNRLYDRADRAYLAHWLRTCPAGQDRLTWTARCPFPRRDELVVTVTAGGATFPVRRAASEHDWQTASDPVWWIGHFDAKLRLRNLCVRESLLTPDDVDQTCVLPGQPVRDADLYWQDGQGAWRRFPAESLRGSMSLLFVEMDGPVRVRWASQQRQSDLAAGVLTVRRATGASVQPLEPDRVLNLFDSLGTLLGLPRVLTPYPGEDNLTYQERLLLECQAPPAPTVAGVVRGVASRLGRVALTRWDGAGDLILDPDGSLRITRVELIGEPRLVQVEEELLPQGLVDGTTASWLATWGHWREGAAVFQDGRPRSDWALDDATAVVTLATPTAAPVRARFSLERYRVERGEDGYVRRIALGTGLPPRPRPGAGYLVACSREVDAHVPDLPGYQKTALLTAAGLPNGLFLELARQLTAGNPTAVGRGGWGSGHWFEGGEDRPVPARLPLPFDAHGDEE